ncbi:hypothetical protein SCLCIDRAFT_103907 [Scleroderma citrinum Foug A]|uniref:Uncharacterized protein n=1 Tax=Scleroderma citrinum Foug A TaxID=1036808 RepID=A0A0C3AVL6_9AGAM|nr:hypothetical protein SCLCIDRAFT_103907 [Scleroderma citrinum Foug A]
MATTDPASRSTAPTGNGDARTPSPVPTVPAPTLQDRIQTLTELHARLATLRHVPTVLLKPPTAFSPTFDVVDPDFSVARFSANPAHDLFQTVRSVTETVRSEKVQDALGAAKTSEEGDKSELGLGVSIRPLSPVGSPQPYIPPPVRSSSLFSPPEDDPPPLRAESLIEFVCSFNRGTLPEFKEPPVPPDPGNELPPPLPKCKLAIWSRTKRGPQNETTEVGRCGSWFGNTKLSCPTVLRFTISDVLTAYVSLVFRSEEDPLVVENVTVFGPRERKLPHEQSHYQVFRVLSQHIAKMLQSHPCVPLQTLMHALVSYRALFVDRCTSCQRVLSAEGHIPPVGRIWAQKDSSNLDGNHNQMGPKGPTERDVPTPEPVQLGDVTDHSTGYWEPRHVTCLYS